MITKEVLGRSATEFWQIAEKTAEIVQALQEKGKWFGELVAKKKDGTFFDIQVSTNMVTDKANRPIGMMASFVDITERKQAEGNESPFRAMQLTINGVTVTCHFPSRLI